MIMSMSMNMGVEDVDEERSGCLKYPTLAPHARV